jgi:hypothetical protein
MTMSTPQPPWTRGYSISQLISLARRKHCITGSPHQPSHSPHTPVAQTPAKYGAAPRHQDFLANATTRRAVS